MVGRPVQSNDEAGSSSFFAKKAPKKLCSPSGVCATVRVTSNE
jgi:hypothetical protein